MGNSESTEQASPDQPSESPFLKAVSELFDDKPADEPSFISAWYDDIMKPDEQLPNQQLDQPRTQQSPSNLPVQRKEPQLGWGGLDRSVAKEEIKGYLTLKFVRGLGFPKKDSCRLEIGYSDPNSGSWVDPTHVRKSSTIKASDSPIFNFDFVGSYTKTQCVKAMFYATDKGLLSKDKEYLVGSVKLDYQFFRTWYLQGKQNTEKKIALIPGTEKEFKGTRYVFLTVRYEGSSLAPDKEGVLGGGNTTLGFSGPNINTAEIGKEFDKFITETGEMLDVEINEATDSMSPMNMYRAK